MLFLSVFFTECLSVRYFFGGMFEFEMHYADSYLSVEKKKTLVILIENHIDWILLPFLNFRFTVKETPLNFFEKNA